ncbi:plasmodesmata-located protein 6 isoform X1 [Populus alba]|uniref:plasmodesmata-located protein 6 isoform X1 n=1 Tax=Populus alba TaxID=43335 RepID=UPI00158A437A|nr:plasmodesmata-located protein 6-like isoform X1 [Populus alba]
MSRTLRMAPLISLLIIALLTTPAISSVDTFVYGVCSQVKYTPGSPYESNVNSLLTSLVNSATLTIYNNFTIKSPTSQDTLYGLFQCRGDLSNGDCASCVARAVSQLGTLCLDSAGGALQLDGCFVKYDNTTFLGVEDKTEVLKKCGPLIAYDSDELNRRDAVMDYLGTCDGSYKPFRIGGSGDISAVAQCVQDLSASECQDCLSEVVGRLKTYCGAAASGDLYLAKCYVRFSKAGAHSHGGYVDHDENDEVEKTLAILVGLIAGVALLIVFLAFLRKACGKGKCKLLVYLSFHLYSSLYCVP